MSPARIALMLAVFVAGCTGPQPLPTDKAAEAATSAAGKAAAAASDAHAAGKDLAGTAKAAGAAAAGTAAAAAENKVAEVWKGPPAVDQSALDSAVAPCDDFYQHACGSWMKNTPIPGDRSSWTRSFSVINERNEALVKQLLEDAAAGKGDSDNPYAQKIGDFFATCMDESKAETASLASLKQELARIDALKDLKATAKLVARLHLGGVRALFDFAADQDSKDATQIIGIADQGGIGLPDRDFYLKPDRKPILDAYEQLVIHQLVNLGAKEKVARAQAKAILKIETQLAAYAMDKVVRRDPYAVYHRIDRKGLVELSKHFDWDGYFTDLGQPKLQAINVVAPEFFKGMDAFFGPKAKLADVKTYLRWRTLSAATPALGKKFVDEAFAFTAKITGQKEQLPRWKRCVGMTSAALSEAIGRSYVSRAFGKLSKPMALDMIQRIEAAFEANLATLSWMDDATKAKAKEKVHKIANKIGYADQWRDYSSLEIGRESLLKNRLAGTVFEARRELAKIGKPVDRNEHQMPPTLVNAQYNATMNDITFPAAILQPPFFSADSFGAANYGGIGMVVGHELTHGFDDQGRQFDADGNLKDWWSKEAGESYKAKAACVAKQYGGWDAIEGQKLNGELTLGENIGDNGGLKMAFLAYQALRAGQPPVLQGTFTEEQQFFLAFAQSWCTNYRPETARLQAQTNEHSTSQWRVNGSVINSPEFAAAFSCKPGSKMAPADRCLVW